MQPFGRWKHGNQAPSIQQPPPVKHRFMFASLLNLLAETHMAEVSLQYREDTATPDASGLWYLLIPVLAVAIALVIYKIYDRPAPIVNTPQGMLHELCKAHRINAAGRKLLDLITEEAELDHPATIFLGVAQFEAAVEKAGVHLEYGRRDKVILDQLRRRLFVA